jgi:hypothetical protein
MVTDAEVITIAVAQQLLAINSDEQFCAGAARRLGHLFPRLPRRPGHVKRRHRLADTIEALAAHSPGSFDDLLVVDSTQCNADARSRRRAAARWATRPTTTTAPVTAALFRGLTLHGTAPPGRSR